MKISSPLFISEKIDLDTNIIWFENSNKYIVVNDVINNMVLNKLIPSKYPLDGESVKTLKKLSNESIQDEINNLILDCNKSIKSKEVKNIDLKKFNSEHYTKICFNDRVAKIEYENKNLKQLIDPKFSHLSSDKNEEVTFKVFLVDKTIFLFKEDLIIGNWQFNEMHEFQGKVSMELTSFFHNKNDQDWSCVFHGSTLFKDNKSIMLTGESGSGKSSLSTLLMANDFSLIADDFSPMSSEGLHYNFPSAISIKEGFYQSASKLYNNFNDLEEYYISDIKGNVKYLPPNINKTTLSSVCNIVFNVKFAQNLPNEIVEVNKGKALNNILPDSWISKNKKHARCFINWVKSTKFYDLTYSNNSIMIEMINKIIK